MLKTLVLLLSAEHGALLHAVVTALINLSAQYARAPAYLHARPLGCIAIVFARPACAGAACLIVHSAAFFKELAQLAFVEPLLQIARHGDTAYRGLAIELLDIVIEVRPCDRACRPDQERLLLLWQNQTCRAEVQAAGGNSVMLK